MALDKFKNINDVLSKGTSLTTELTSTELKLIDKGFIATPFLIGNNDVLEFILYDSTNNVLEQIDYGNVRYISVNDISNYIIRSENVLDTIYDGGGFLIDVKKLVKEAGYNTGVFRVQFNFVNNRVGSKIEMDRMWIHEISPSRTELRLLPYNNFNSNIPYEVDIERDLNQAYESFVIGRFSGDEVYAEINEIINRINPQQLQDTFAKIKSKDYIDRMQYEFGIQNYDQFFSNVLNSMKEAVRHALLHKNSIIGSSDFGKPLGDEIDFTYYNKNDIINLLNKKFRDACDFHLPTRTLSQEVLIDSETQQSIDKLSTLIQKLETDKVTENVSTERVSVPIPTYGEIKDAVLSVQKTEIIVPNVEEPVRIEVPIMETPSTAISDVINEKGTGGLFGRLRSAIDKKGNKPRTGFLNKDITKKKLGLFGGTRNTNNEVTGGGTTTGTSEGDRRGGIPSSIAERLRNKRDNQK
jgi:hypothetical protein